MDGVSELLLTGSIARQCRKSAEFIVRVTCRWWLEQAYANIPQMSFLLSSSLKALSVYRASGLHRRALLLRNYEGKRLDMDFFRDVRANF